MFYWILLFPLLFFGANLEVLLPTRASLTPIYLSGFSNEEMREVLKTDLNRSGLAAVVPNEEHLDESFQGPFDVTLWRKEKIPFCLSAKVVQNRLEVTAFNVEQGTTKKYPAIPLERQAIHRLADAIQKDLFGMEGISSLKLIYTIRTKNHSKGLGWLSEVWVCDADGKNPIQVTRENSYCLCPAFLPGSATEFFYVSEKTGQSKIYRASLANPKGELMVDLRGNQALASMKGSKMAFITDVAGRPDLFIQSLDAAGRMVGKARQLFSSPRATQASPTFSPDGKKIAFVSDKDGPPRIYVLDVTDAKSTKKPQPQLLTKKNRENTSPAWSPDGTKLAYSAKVDDVRQIWIYDFLTGEETPLTSGPENKENPSWAPDSFHLVYNTESEEHCDLYLMHLNHGDPIHIGKGRFASWQQK
ncbi:MAG: translocation protein TolB [Parachlamydiales bacterium]|nr:translocation protein TolB [Parachlamydiales bacterium]